MSKARSSCFGPSFSDHRIVPEATTGDFFNQFSGGLQGRNDGRGTFKRRSVQILWAVFSCLSTMLAWAGLLRKKMPKDMPESNASEGPEGIPPVGQRQKNPPGVRKKAKERKKWKKYE